MKEERLIIHKYCSWIRGFSGISLEGVSSIAGLLVMIIRWSFVGGSVCGGNYKRIKTFLGQTTVGRVFCGSSCKAFNQMVAGGYFVDLCLCCLKVGLALYPFGWWCVAYICPGHNDMSQNLRLWIVPLFLVIIAREMFIYRDLLLILLVHAFIYTISRNKSLLFHKRRRSGVVPGEDDLVITRVRNV